MVSFRISWIFAALACATFIWGVPGLASADFICSAPSADVTAVAAPAAPAVEAVAAVSPREIVASQLAVTGMAGADIEARLAEMTEADLQSLAASPQQVQFAAGGFVFWPIAVILIVTAVLILYLLFTNEL